MNETRRKEIDAEMEVTTHEFHQNASHGDGNFGVLYMSCNVKEGEFWVSLECERETFKNMMLSLLSEDELVAEDIMIAVDAYKKDKGIDQQPKVIDYPKDWLSLDDLRANNNKTDLFGIGRLIRDLVKLTYLLTRILAMLECLKSALEPKTYILPEKKHLLN